MWITFMSITNSGVFIVAVSLLFFFKQKTAYEMRISDWSSDVCSSDLRLAVPGTERAQVDHLGLDALGGERLRGRCRDVHGRRPGDDGDVDRKSVVKGKSESVSVDLGGRRIMITRMRTRRTKH